jgi:hypothetical protein
VYRRLAEMLGLNDESMVLSVIIRKVITNLKYWGNCEMIINKTLQLLSDLSVGYGTVRKLVKLEEVGFLLANHTAEHYPFLGRHLVSSGPLRVNYHAEMFITLNRLRFFASVCIMTLNRTLSSRVLFSIDFFIK